MRPRAESKVPSASRFPRCFQRLLRQVGYAGAAIAPIQATYATALGRCRPANSQWRPATASASVLSARPFPGSAVGSVLALALALPVSAFATDGDSILTRSTLSGDWDGARTTLAGQGVAIRLEATGFYQGMFSGSGKQDWGTAGRGDAWIDFDSTKLGLWGGGGLMTHVEYRGGELTSGRGGALWPVNTAVALPTGQPEELVATSIYFTQRIGDSTNLLVGKINAVDLLAGDPFFGGWGIHRFLNLAFVAPPSGVLPPVIMGAVVSYRDAPFSYTAMVFDPNNQTGNYSLNHLFSDGVNVSLSGKWSGALDGRATSVALTGIYSTKDGADLSQIVLPPNLQTSSKEGSWNVNVQFGHLLVESETLRGQGFGVYGKAAIADGNPNPIRGSFAGGFAAHGVIPGRPLDSFGVGYYYYKFSRELQDIRNPLIGEFGSEQGLEVYYKLAVTPWFRLSADLQMLDPALQAAKRATVGGLRLNLVF